MNPLYLIPGWVKLAILAALAAGAIWGWNAYTGGLVAKGDKAGYDRAVGEFKDKELQAIQAVRAEELRRQVALEEVIHATKSELAAARVDGAAAVVAGERLREQLAAAIRRSRSGPSPAPAGGSAPADPTGDLLERVQRGLDTAAESIARHADESRIAGQACERAYEALTAK
jgi:hypothetical protein